MSDGVIIAVIGFLGGSAITAIINALAERARQKRKRQYEKEDSKTANIDALKADIDVLKTGEKWMLYDRIRHIGQKYIANGAVDFDDRRILNEMHVCYHEGLGGNGDLDNLMGQVNKLPLKGQAQAKTASARGFEA
ncbi:MAG: hypothetical protein IJS25_07330 [Bacteroidales bacterium]|nr:hypothetical protein [Bacteroidales bacterium]